MIRLKLDKHTSQKYNDELEEVRSELLEMGGFVEKQLRSAITALEEADSVLAQSVRDNDKAINQLEIDIDENCTRILAKRQPAAGDLRLVLGITKITTDLERIGDESKRIAKLAIKLSEEGMSPRGYVELREIGDKVSTMVRNSLDAFARFDLEVAVRVAQQDEEVDADYKRALQDLTVYMEQDPQSISRVINILWALRGLERVGDHAHNIAEHVIYMVKGRDVRHTSIEEIESEAKSE